MSLNGKRIILTGAAGGIGSLLARELDRQDAQLALVDANAAALAQLADELGQAHAVPGDLSSAEGCEAVVSAALHLLGGVDILVNLAGLMSFRAIEDEDPAYLQTLMQVNLIAPMLLSRLVIPHFHAQGSGHIVNVGSIFGSINFAYFTAYSTSKAGVRGFSEALRRELADSHIDVTYIAPRAVRTPLNTDVIMRMGEATGMNMDEPEQVAAKIAAAIARRDKDVYLGFPEKLFVRINAILPRLVDKAVAAQNRTTRDFAKEAVGLSKKP
jgi:short-subunit dehydrogenase